ncbi:MAG: hypothetical protein ACLUHE_00470 [Christensenellales bacterium]
MQRFAFLAWIYPALDMQGFQPADAQQIQQLGLLLRRFACRHQRIAHARAHAGKRERRVGNGGREPRGKDGDRSGSAHARRGKEQHAGKVVPTVVTRRQPARGAWRQTIPCPARQARPAPDNSRRQARHAPGLQQRLDRPGAALRQRVDERGLWPRRSAEAISSRISASGR